MPNATIRRQAEPAEREISPEAWDDYVAGFRVGNEKHLGVQIGTVVEQHATILEPAEQPSVGFTEPNGPLWGIDHEHVTPSQANEVLSHVGDRRFPSSRFPSGCANICPKFATDDSLYVPRLINLFLRVRSRPYSRAIVVCATPHVRAMSVKESAR